MANGGQNINQTASAGLNGAMGATAAGMGYRAPQLATTSLTPYQNPFQQQVIDNSIADMDRARQMTQNMNGAAATSAGAFGGSRHGLVEAETNRNFMDRAGALSAQLNQQGFNNAQQAAQFDIGNNMASQQMRMGAAGQLGGLADQAYNTGRQINSDIARDGFMQQALNQQVIDAGRGQFAGFTGAPQQALNLPLAALGATPNVGTQTTEQSPGLFNYLSLGLGLL